MQHQLERINTGWRCRVCRWAWQSKPAPDCPGVPRYSDWTSANAAGMYSETQLRVMNKQPGNLERGVLYAGGMGWINVYALAEAVEYTRSVQSHPHLHEYPRITQQVGHKSDGFAHLLAAHSITRMGYITINNASIYSAITITPRPGNIYEVSVRPYSDSRTSRPLHLDWLALNEQFDLSLDDWQPVQPNEVPASKQ